MRSGLNFAVPQQTLEQALKGLAMEPKEDVPRLKIKHADLDDTTHLSSSNNLKRKSAPTQKHLLTWEVFL